MGYHSHTNICLVETLRPRTNRLKDQTRNLNSPRTQGRCAKPQLEHMGFSQYGQKTPRSVVVQLISRNGRVAPLARRVTYHKPASAKNKNKNKKEEKNPQTKYQKTAFPMREQWINRNKVYDRSKA